MPTAEVVLQPGIEIALAARRHSAGDDSPWGAGGDADPGLGWVQSMENSAINAAFSSSKVLRSIWPSS